MSVSKLVTTELLNMDDESARTLGVLDIDGWKKHTASSSVEHVVEVTAKGRLFLVTSVTPIFHTKNSTV